MKKFEFREMIRKFNMSKAIKDNGEVGLRFWGKPSKAERDWIIKNKPAILEELERIAKEEEEAKKRKIAEKIKEIKSKDKVTACSDYGFTCEIFPIFSEKIQKRVMRELEKEGLEKVTNYGDYSINYVYDITGTELLERLEKAKAEFEQEELDKKTKEKERMEKIFKKAKETGKEQEISRYTTSCNDDNEDCDIDIIITYAMPDGTMKTVRNHTW